ncbi:MAG TPA: Ig-like domain-containing protein, partial [Candidatus Anammoximicrobium sp.]|nr:Ig-like domain-containing protein [Candidatus Anammoximicrobium sp.]
DVVASVIAGAATDAAGNASAASTSTDNTVTYDTTAPTGSVPDLASGSDLGQSNTDNTTAAVVAVFDGIAADALSGVQKVELYVFIDGVNDVLLGMDDAEPFYSIMVDTVEGEWDLYAVVYDKAGNTFTTGTLTVLVDQTEPQGDTPQLAAGSDSGVSNNDNVTQGHTPEFLVNNVNDNVNEDGGSGIWQVWIKTDEGDNGGQSVLADINLIEQYRAVLATLAEGDREIWAEIYDVAGNVYQTEALIVTVDRTGPEVVAVIPSDPMINDATASFGTFTLTVMFNEDMDTTVDPVLHLSANPGTTLTFDSGVWTDLNTYQATYAVADANVTELEVNVDVTGALDVAGNSQADYEPVDTYSIDTLNPMVVSIEVSNPLITDADDGSSFTVTVQFSEAMDTSV